MENGLGAWGYIYNVRCGCFAALSPHRLGVRHVRHHHRIRHYMVHPYMVYDMAYAYMVYDYMLYGYYVPVGGTSLAFYCIAGELKYEANGPRLK